jgi:hypothetical protein
MMPHHVTETSAAAVYRTRAAVLFSVGGKFPPRLLESESTKECD